MITWADLIMRLLNSLFDSKLKLTNLHRDKRDRVADYFDQISKTLLEAAADFKNNDRPWDKYREVSYYLNDFVNVVGDNLKDDKKLITAYRELVAAAHSDFLLLGGSRERTIVDAITVKPPNADYDYRWQDTMEEIERDKDAVIGWKGNPVKALTEPELKRILTREVDRIKEAAGLFRAMAAQLRATDP